MPITQAEDEKSDDAPFQHYSLKHRAIAWISANLFDGFTYTVRRGLLTGMKRKGGLGWLPAALSESTVSAEMRFWREFDFSGMTVYDIGSFHGLLALHFAARAKAVVCFEPNTRNYSRLMENLQLNGVKNTQVRKAGVGARSEKLSMVAVSLTPGGASLDARAGERMSRSGAKTTMEEIQVVSLDEEIRASGLPKPDFIKIDIEGWELEALRGAREMLAAERPALFLEMHGDTMREKRRKVSEIVDFLWGLNYRDIRHVETGSSVKPENAFIAAQGHLYCPHF